ncbi:aldose 1-epimerase [Phenylobacterium sp.]|jgi:aldose 1-epimerase|uniref:aldose 1-epimerase n=1 Tax=Phenylobacterium sp. TaxID=1871053 RepID=UPI00378514BF
MAGPHIGGLPVVTLSADPAEGAPSIVEATVLPGRGFMLLQAIAALPSGERVELLHAPSVEAAATQLDGGPEDFAGSRAFSFGGAVLAPYANRIRGRPLAETREIETAIDGEVRRLPRNWGGKAPGAETYAMHGLILDAAVSFEQVSPAEVTGSLPRAFGDHWPGELNLGFAWRLAAGRIELEVSAHNRGEVASPLGIGWHPYFRVPSGGREQARLRVPAALRTEVNDYDEVLPTGRLLDVAGTPYDFRDAKGRPLGDLYLDDCFTGLSAADGVVAEMTDPVAGLGVRLTSPSPPVRAVQVYAPPEQPFIVMEPQFNLADPFGAWRAEVDTGMVRVAPGQAATYRVELSLFRP